MIPQQSGFHPVLHKLDNETSKELIDAIEKRGSKHKTAPPANHKRNPAKRATQTHKTHFASILNGLDGRFPEGAWDLLAPQTNTNLNLLRPCGMNPAHSACSCIHGHFNFDAHPLAPPGCQAIVHVQSAAQAGTRGSWENCGGIGHHTGPTMASCKKAAVESDMVEFFPRCPIPPCNPTTKVMGAVEIPTDVLQEQAPDCRHVTNADKLTDVLQRLQDMCEGQSTADQSKPVQREEPTTNEGPNGKHADVNRHRLPRRNNNSSQARM